VTLAAVSSAGPSGVVVVVVLAAMTGAVAMLAAAEAAGRAAVRRRCLRWAPAAGAVAPRLVPSPPFVPWPFLAAWRRLAPWQEQRVQARRRAELPVALDALGRSLRAGASVRTALSDLARAETSPAPALQGDLDAIVAVLDADLGLPEALRQWKDRRPDPDVRFVAAALAVGAGAGSLSARTVEDVAGVLRGRLDAGAESRALATQAQFSALVMVLAPIVFLVGVATADRAVATVVLTTPIGWICVAGGLLLDLGAALVMRRIVGSVR